MTESPIQRLLTAVDSLDADSVTPLFAPDIRLLAADGRRAEGTEEARQLIADVIGMVRSMRHEIMSEWREDNVWIAEVSATYELRDWLTLRDVPRAFVVYGGPNGITDLHVYGAHERPLSEHGTDAGEWRVGGRLMLPL